MSAARITRFATVSTIVVGAILLVIALGRLAAAIEEPVSFRIEVENIGPWQDMEFNGGYNSQTFTATLNDGDWHIESDIVVDTVNGTQIGVTETIPSGWRLTSVECLSYVGPFPIGTTVSYGYDLDSGYLYVNPEPGQDIRCTFTNSYVAASIAFRAVVASGDTNQTFTFDGRLSGNFSGLVLDNGEWHVDDALEVPNQYALVQKAIPGWETSVECTGGDVVNSGTYANGDTFVHIEVEEYDDVRCTFTNTYVAASIRFRAVVASGDTTQTFTFDGRLSGGNFSGLTLANGEWHGDSAIDDFTQQYAVVQKAIPGWETSVSCTGGYIAGTGTFANGDTYAHIDVDKLDEVSCVFTNTYVAASIKFRAVVVSGDTGQKFTFDGRLSGGNFSGLTLANGEWHGDNAIDDFTQQYAVVQKAVPGWETSVECTGGYIAGTGTFANGDTYAHIDVDKLDDVSCTFSNKYVNEPPVAKDDSLDAVEDTTLTVVAPGVLENDTDPNSDTLTTDLVSDVQHGSLTLNADGSLVYDPAPDYCGPDGFTYRAFDGLEYSATAAKVSLTVKCVDDPPEVSLARASAGTVQYSDLIVPIVVTATDKDTAPGDMSFTLGPIADLQVSASCTAVGDGSSCSWTIYGPARVAQGSHDIAIDVADLTTTVSSKLSLSVLLEDALVAFGTDNPIAIPVTAAGSGASEPFALLARVWEAPESGARAAPGNINLADVLVTLVPVGVGSQRSVTCTPTAAVTPYDYSSVLEVTCDFSGVPVNAYVATVSVGGKYYQGNTDEDVIVVYDPSLGFTTGGGWFAWPGTGERTTFAYTMKYNKKGTSVQGSFVLMRHTGEWEGYRVKSNAISGLAVGQEIGMGWAAFLGKATYFEPGMLEPEGNHGFTVYVEDHGVPGAGNDRIWLEVVDRNGAAVPLSLTEPAGGEAVELGGGNIVVPHKPSRREK